MPAGNDIDITEELLHQLIGRYVASIEVLKRRIQIKDEHIAHLEAQIPQSQGVPPNAN